MKVIVVVKNGSSKINNDLKTLKKIFVNKKIEFRIITYDEVEDFYNSLHDSKIFKNVKYDLMISFGGDGTVLKSARIARKMDIPIFGINEGTLGFLNSVHGVKNIKYYLDKIEKKEFIYEKRSMIDVQIYRGKKKIYEAYAVNEATILTKNLGKIGKYEVFIDDFTSAFNDYRADGLIISNPTGSTGHSFSAGGPIVAPDVNCFIITAICPHAFNQRSVVINGEKKIFVKIINDNQVADVDGRVTFDLLKNDIVKLTKLKKELKFITFEKNCFINNISEKIKKL